MEIPATQRRMGRKYLERLVGKLRSMHLTVPGVVGGLFHIQRVLNQGGVDRAWISLDFHRKLADRKALFHQGEPRPTHLAEIVRWELTHLGFCDMSGLGAGGAWIDPDRMVNNMV